MLFSDVVPQTIVSSLFFCHEMFLFHNDGLAVTLKEHEVSLKI